MAGPHPFPIMVREFQRIIGVEARQQVLDLTGRLPDAVCACVGGGSNAIGIFHAFVPDTERAPVRLRGRRRRRRAPGGTRRASPAARPACCTAPGRTSCRTRTARPSRATRSRPAWTIPGVGPEHAYLHDTGRATYEPVTDAEAMAAFRALARTEGISRRSSRRTRSPARMRLARELGPDATILINLSGRGDKDVETAISWFDLETAGG